MKSILMVAFHYPPAAGSSGLLRTLSFSRYLGDHGWRPIVLSANARAHERVDERHVGAIPADVVVERAFALDAAHHLAVRGRYFRWTALPDRWLSWWLGAVPAGLRLIRRYRPDVIFSTFPIPTAHLIGLTLHQMTGLPWVADFRDPLAQHDYPADPLQRRLFHRLDRATVTRCARAVFTAPGAAGLYAKRYPGIPAERWTVISNGFAAEDFAFLDDCGAMQPGAGERLVLLHSGSLYPSERDPTALFAALADLRRDGAIGTESFALRLRATGHDAIHQALLEEHGITDLVSLEPHIPYQQALAEMRAVDALVILQASNCNAQIPAKLYEYLRIGRPILALTDPDGDTAGALRGAGLDSILPLDSRDRVRDGLRDFLTRLRSGTAPVASADEVARHTRESRTRELARLLDEVAAIGSAAKRASRR